MCEHFLNQYILTPARNNNILDLFLTNDESLVTNVNAIKTRLSDHNLVDIMISSNPLSPDKSAVPAFDDNSFRALDFNKAEFVKIKQDLSEIEWDQLRDLCSFEEFPILFTDTVFQVCRASTPLKKNLIGEAKAIKCFAKEGKKDRGTPKCCLMPWTTYSCSESPKQVGIDTL